MILASLVFPVFAIGIILLSYFVKKRAAHIALNLVGVFMICTATISMLSGFITGLYAEEHRRVENGYHKAILSHVAVLLQEGQIENAMLIMKKYESETKGSTFYRSSLQKVYELVRDQQADATGPTKAQP